MQLQLKWQNRNFTPVPALIPYFLAYRSVVGKGCSSKALPFTIFPDGRAHILFHLFISNDQHQGALRSRLTLVGPRSIFKEINRQNRLLTLIFSFRPIGAFPFFSFPIKEIADIAINLEDVLGNGAQECRERMMEEVLEGELDAAIHILEAYLLKQISDRSRLRPIHPIVRKSVDWLQKDAGISVATLAANHGISTRYLHQLFTTQVGVGAKRFCRIQRALSTLAQAKKGWEYGWADLALNQGYYDQSHMIDEFQSLLGDSPQRMIEPR